MKRLLNVGLIVILLICLATPVFAQVNRPDVRFTIDQIEAYRNVVELNDQLYIITATIDYGTNPTEAVDLTFLVRLLNGGLTLATATFYPFFSNGYSQGIATIYFSAASPPPAWNPVGGYDVEITGNPGLQWMDTTATHAMEGAISDNVTGFDDQTSEANSAALNDMTLPPSTPAINDAYYFGSTGMFNLLTVNLGTNGTWGGSYVWEYWDGDSWNALSGITDGSTGFTAGTGVHDVEWTCPTTWQQVVVDGINAYWVRFRIVTYTSGIIQSLGTQCWTNTMDAPPSITSNVFSLWFDDGTITGTQDRLTTRIRSIAQTLENLWAGTTDLIETIAGVKKLTDEGEDYFTNAFAGIDLREVCPDLFAALISNPDFSQNIIVQDAYVSGDTANSTTHGVNWNGQTFTASQTYTITGAWIKASRLSAPGDVTVSLRATLAGLPFGADLVSGTIAGADFSATTLGSWQEVSFTEDYDLVSGTVYALVVRAIAGNAANYIGWKIDDTGAYTGGQASVSAGSGAPATWAAIAGQDFMFQIVARDAFSLSYRDRLAGQLVGTDFDMTELGVLIGMSRMWASTIVFFIGALVLAVFFARMARTYKLTTMFMTLICPFGALIGFMYLEVGIVGTFLLAAGTIWVFFLSGSP